MKIVEKLKNFVKVFCKSEVPKVIPVNRLVSGVDYTFDVKDVACITYDSSLSAMLVIFKSGRFSIIKVRYGEYEVVVGVFNNWVNSRLPKETL